MPSHTPVELVRAWHEAVNRRDVAGVLALCADDVAVGGPRGTARGHEVMRAWLERSGIHLEPQEELVEVEGRVSVHEHARWRSADAPEGVPVDAPADTWVIFEAADGLVRSVRRYETPEEADRARARPANQGGQVSEMGRLDPADAGTPIVPDQATAGYPDSESGAPDEGTAGPNARPRDDRPDPRR